MNTKMQVGLAVGAGYLLGRTRRMKTALMLAGAGLTGRFPAAPRDLLERGGKALAASPEVAKLGKSIRGELLSAAKTAATTAASGRINSLSERLQSGGKGVVEGGEGLLDEVGQGVGEVVTGKKRRHAEPEPEDEYDEDEYEEDEEEEPEEEEEPPARKRPAARRRTQEGSSPSTRSRSSARASDEDEPSARPRKTRTPASGDSAPVRRTRK